MGGEKFRCENGAWGDSDDGEFDDWEKSNFFVCLREVFCRFVYFRNENNEIKKYF